MERFVTRLPREGYVLRPGNRARLSRAGRGRGRDDGIPYRQRQPGHSLPDGEVETGHYTMALNPVDTDEHHAEWLARSRAAWNSRAAGWDAMLEERPDLRQMELERALVALALSPGLRVLDAGCGTGQWAVGFA